MSRQTEHYYRNRENILAKRHNNSDEVNQIQRNHYWRKKNKNGKPWNVKFIQYIQQLLREDMKMNEH